MQTSIEWLIEQFNLQSYIPHIESAKKMYKQEQEKLIEDAINNYENGWNARREEQKQLITEIMEQDAKDGLYEDDVEKLAANLANPNADKTDNWKEGYLYAKESLYTEEQVQKMIDDALTNYQIGWADRKKQFSLYEHKETIASAYTPISKTFLESMTLLPQQEISDEEIENASQFYKWKINKTFFIEGAKWYREQLKQRQ